MCRVAASPSFAIQNASEGRPSTREVVISTVKADNTDRIESEAADIEPTDCQNCIEGPQKDCAVAGVGFSILVLLFSASSKHKQQERIGPYA